MPMIDVAVYLAVTWDVCVRGGVSTLGKGIVHGDWSGSALLPNGGEGVLVRRQWAPASAERPILRIPVSCLLSTVSRGLLNRGHVLGRHLSCNYSTRIRFWWCVMITNNYCAFHASKGPRWGPRASIQRTGGRSLKKKKRDEGGKCEEMERQMTKKRVGLVSCLNHLEMLSS